MKNLTTLLSKILITFILLLTTATISWATDVRGPISTLQNYPNPFNPETWIPFQLAENANVTISIYDISGKLIRTLVLGDQHAGMYITKERAVYWDGRNNLNEKVSNGVYFYKVSAGEFSAVKRMAIVK